MDLSGVTGDLKTTIQGLVVIAVVVIGATAAMFMGLCTFEKWWEIILIIIGLIGLGKGSQLILSNKPKEGDPK